MKKLVTPFLLLPLLAGAQSLVSDQPQLRTAFLEDFTGLHCGYCPEGHVIMEGLEEQHGARFVTVGVHAGPFASPSTGEPDFRTPAGTAIDAHFTIGGYPAGVINRHLFNGADDLGRGAWEGAVAEMLALPSPVNLGMVSDFDEGTRELTVTVELLYTADSPLPASDYISVLIKEDHIIAPQTDYGPSGNHAAYDHKHVLRAYITDTWGDAVTTTTAGTSVLRTYTYTLPQAWNAANCRVVAFVSEDRSEVYQAREVNAIGGTTLVIGDLALNGPTFAAADGGSSHVFATGFTNAMGAEATFVATLTVVSAPASWTAGLQLNGASIADPATFALPADATAGLGVEVMPGMTAGIGTYRLSIASADAPEAPVLEQEFNVISGVTDLVVTHTGAEPWEPIYLNGLSDAGNGAYAATSKDKFVRFGQDGALGSVFNLYLNVSWTFPALTDDEVAVLQAHMDAGGDLMIAGQDIGWDNSGATGSYGTPVTQSFFTNYLHATYVADGSTANSSVNFLDADPVFGGLPNTTIANVFNNNTYPEEITPIAPAVGIFHYTTNVNKIGGLRCDNGTYKVVYFGVGPEQMANASTGRAMISLSHDWFYGIVSVDELDAAFLGMGTLYPVPADAQLTIPVDAAIGATHVLVLDAMGRRVLEQQLPAGGDRAVLDVGSLTNGTYRVALGNEQGLGQARTFVVLR
jgi:hypothetical protein